MRTLILTDDRLVPDTRNFAATKTERDVFRALQELGFRPQFCGTGKNLEDLQTRVRTLKPHLIFNLLEEFNDSAFGEARIVAWFELQDLRYTGCTSRTLLLLRDKVLAKRVIKSLGLLTPDFEFLARGQKPGALNKLRFPLFVKSATEDASRGISQKSRVRNHRELLARVDFLRAYLDSDILIEEFIPGRDVYLGAFSKDVFPALALNVGTTKPQDAFATEQLKWSSRRQLELAAKFVREQKNHQLKKEIIVIQKAMQIRGPVRFDYRQSVDGRHYFLEINANPDLCQEGEFAEAARLRGLPYKELIRKICNHGLRRRKWD